MAHHSGAGTDEPAASRAGCAVSGTPDNVPEGTLAGPARVRQRRGHAIGYARGVRKAWTLAIVLAACGAPARSRTRAPVAPTETEVRPATPPGPAVVVVGRAPTDAAGAAGAAGVDGERAVAIAKLEALIEAYPDDLRFTPDALLRLGSLRLDESDEALERDDDGGATRAAQAASAALTRLVDHYPRYAHREAGLYLLGHARERAGDDRGALAAWLALAALPSSSQAVEARFRAGELQFVAGDLDAAAASYAAVAAVPGTQFTALARYKLGWSHYRRGAHAEAIAVFQALLDDDAAGPGAADLRAELSDYVALSLTEADRDVDVAGAVGKAPASTTTTATVARVVAHLGDGRSASRRQVAERAAGFLRQEARLAEAAAVYRALLAVTTDAGERARLTAAQAELARLRP